MTLSTSLLAACSSTFERCCVRVGHANLGLLLNRSFTMNTLIHSARRLPVLSLFCVGLAATGLAQAAEPQLVGPRNTIPQMQARTGLPSQHSEQLRASEYPATVCSTVVVKHYGHPGKGFDRVERIQTACDKSRLSKR
jgi:hypothetical protein